MAAVGALSQRGLGRILDERGSAILLRGAVASVVMFSSGNTSPASQPSGLSTKSCRDGAIASALPAKWERRAASRDDFDGAVVLVTSITVEKYRILLRAVDKRHILIYVCYVHCGYRYNDDDVGATVHT